MGKRTAERVVLELRDRLGAARTAPAPRRPAAQADVLSCRRATAWWRLGFRPEEADAALADAPAGLDAEGLVRHGLAG